MSTRPLSAEPFEAQFRGGEGEPLVLLHGGTATWHTWSRLLDALARDYDVLAPTMPGHHGGPPLSGAGSAAAYADGVEAAMDAAGFATAHLAGNSLGGWVAMELARRGRARSVVALAPAGGWPVGERRVRRFFVNTERQVRLGRRTLPLLMRSGVARRAGFRTIAAYGDRLTHDEALLMLEGLLNADLTAVRPLFQTTVEPYDDPGVPVLIAWPTGDRLLPAPTYTDAWRQAAPFATWWWLPGVGHVPMIDDPDLVVRTIQAWVGATAT
jgi:pimeloyl-ACP methyl ester carboxylesterase